MDVIIAVDVGTTEAKCSVLDRDGRIVARANAGYPLVQRGLAVEQQPEDWWRATVSVLRAALHHAPAARAHALVLSGQMQNTILVGEAGVLPPTLLYSDTRAQDEARLLSAEHGNAALQRLTGNVQDAASLLAKLLWMREHAPQAYKEAHTLFVGAHDYVTWRLTGERVTDYTTASTTGLLDLAGNRWASELLAALDLRADWLPELVAATAPVGVVSADAAALTHVPAGTPVIHGAGDAATTTLGAGAGALGHAALYLGTSGWVATSTDAPPVDPTTGIFNLRHPDGVRLLQIGPMITAGGNLGWLHEQFGTLETAAAGMDAAHGYDRLLALAAEVPLGSGGVLYLPYLAGERSPFRDGQARGGFFGLSRTTTRAQMYRAVLEGVACALRQIRDAMPNTAPVQTVSLVGGGARSALWAQIIADMWGSTVRVLAEPQDVGARGAALLAGESLGWFIAATPPAAFLPVAATCQADPARTSQYDHVFARFSTLTSALRGVFGELAAHDPPT